MNVLRRELKLPIVTFFEIGNDDVARANEFFQLVSALAYRNVNPNVGFR